MSRSVALATRSRAPDSQEIREQVNADSLFFYMGRGSAPEIDLTTLTLAPRGWLHSPAIISTAALAA